MIDDLPEVSLHNAKSDVSVSTCSENPGQVNSNSLAIRLTACRLYLSKWQITMTESEQKEDAIVGNKKIFMVAHLALEQHKVKLFYDACEFLTPTMESAG